MYKLRVCCHCRLYTRCPRYQRQKVRTPAVHTLLSTEGCTRPFLPSDGKLNSGMLAGRQAVEPDQAARFLLDACHRGTLTYDTGIDGMHNLVNIAMSCSRFCTSCPSNVQVQVQVCITRTERHAFSGMPCSQRTQRCGTVNEFDMTIAMHWITGEVASRPLLDALIMRNRQRGRMIR